MNMDGYSRAVRLWQSYGIASAADLDKYIHQLPHPVCVPFRKDRERGDRLSDFTGETR